MRAIHRVIVKIISARHVAFVLAGGMLLALGACSTIGTPPAPVTVPQIVAMSKAGDDPGTIIETIRQSHTVYRLSAGQLADLEKQGVPRAVIDYMQRTYIDAVRRDQARADWSYWSLEDDGYWYGGCSYGWGPSWCDWPG